MDSPLAPDHQVESAQLANMPPPSCWWSTWLLLSESFVLNVKTYTRASALPSMLRPVPRDLPLRAALHRDARLRAPPVPAALLQWAAPALRGGVQQVAQVQEPQVIAAPARACTPERTQPQMPAAAAAAASRLTDGCNQSFQVVLQRASNRPRPCATPPDYSVRYFPWPPAGAPPPATAASVPPARCLPASRAPAGAPTTPCPAAARRRPCRPGAAIPARCRCCAGTQRRRNRTAATLGPARPALSRAAPR